MLPIEVSITARCFDNSSGVSATNGSGTGAGFANRDLLDLDALARDRHVGGHRRDLLRDVDAFGHPREHRVLTVERRLVRDADEELRAGAVAAARYEDGRHGAACVLFGIGLEPENAEP